MSDDNFVRIRFGPGETGWAEKLADGKFKINNIPLAGDLNIDDVVTCEEGEDGWLEITEVVETRYAHKTAVKYEKSEQFAALRERVKAAGCKIEGFVGPDSGPPGICAVAHDDSLDLKALIAEIGIESPQFEEAEA